MGPYHSRAQSLPSAVSNLSPVQRDHTSRGGLKGPGVPSSTPAPPRHPISVHAALQVHVLDMKMQCTDHSPHPLPLKQKISITRAQWTQKPDSKQDIALQMLSLRYLILTWAAGRCGGDGLPSSSASKSISHADSSPCSFLHSA